MNPNRPMITSPERSADRSIALRMADANLNRVMEGLRTLEDVARFSDRGALQAAYKSFRHQLLQLAMVAFPSNECLASRDAHSDVGRTEKQSTEMDRSAGLPAIVASAAGRAEQGLRVLEEVAKFIAPESASTLEAVRYRIYDCNARLQLDLHRDVDFLRRAKLYVLVDCSYPIDVFAQRIRDISLAGAELIQLRDKSADARMQLMYAEQAQKELDTNQTRFIFNDRVDLARASGAWGAHLGQEDLEVHPARRQLASEQIIGLSTHTIEQVHAALRLGVDYIGCGPTFPSHTKSFDAFAGTAFLRSVVETLAPLDTGMPAYAIGGIHEGNLQQVLDTGFSRVAVSSAIWRSDEPGRAAASVRRLLD
jgi:thiamine-phosphate pyrophosphorylase